MTSENFSIILIKIGRKNMKDPIIQGSQKFLLTQLLVIQTVCWPKIVHLFSITICPPFDDAMHLANKY